jgi:hypothetical protein
MKMCEKKKSCDNVPLNANKKSRYVDYGIWHLWRGYGAENADEFVEFLQIAEVQPTHHSTDKWTVLNSKDLFNIFKNARNLFFDYEIAETLFTLACSSTQNTSSGQSL